MVARSKTAAQVKPVLVSQRVVRTGEGLRDALFDTLDGLRSGSIKPGDAVAASKVACQIINTVKLELEYQTRAKDIKPGAIGTLRLGSA